MPLPFPLLDLFLTTCPLASVCWTVVGQGPAPARMSPWRRCAFSALTETRIFTYGFFFECVR